MSDDPRLPGQSRHAPHEHGGHAHEYGHGHGHGHGHDHDHAPVPTDAKGARLLGIALLLTAGFMAVEFAGGLIAGSLALLADAGHMLTDAAALGLAWAAVLIAKRPADARRSFGYQRLRVLATFVNGCALLVITAWIAIEAVQRFFNPAPVNGTIILWVGSAGLAVNLLVFAMLRQGHQHDMNVAAAALHVLSDLLGSVAAIVAALVIMATGWTPIDPILSVLVCLLVLRSGWSLLRRATHILLEGTPDNLDVTELRRTLEQQVPAIRDVHHVHSWLVGPQETLLTLHASVAVNADHAAVLRDAKAVLAARYGITHATIQIEAEDCADPDCGPHEQRRAG